MLDDGDVVLHLGDCVEVMAAMPAASVDAIVCDPPYGLGFMGKEWDRPGQAARPTTTSVAKAESPFSRKAAEYGGASYGTDSATTGRFFQAWCETWATEALRVLKPGGHMLAFGGTRTFHRLTCAIEDAGFEIRDCLSWPSIRAAIMARAALPGDADDPVIHRCECTGECGVDHRPRCREWHGFTADTFRGVVVLTVAHLDHTPENCDPDNLRAMCQGCHNRYDAPHRAESRRRNAEQARIDAGQTTLTPPEDTR